MTKEISKEAKRGAIQALWATNKFTLKQIAQTLNVSMSTVQKWKDQSTTKDQTRKRKSKVKKHIRSFIYKLAADKYSGIEKASTRVIANKVKRKFRIEISHMTISLLLRKMLMKPLRAKKTFKLTEDNKGARRFFCDYVNENDIRG